MGRHKIIRTETELADEWYVATEKIVNSINSKIPKKIVSKDRSTFLLNLIELDGVLENHRKNKRDPIFISKGKNVLQSLSYLVLNDAFYDELVLIRKELDIPDGGFDFRKREKNEIDSNDVYKKIENLIAAHKLCYKNDRPKLTKILFFFLLYKMEFDDFFQVISATIFEKEKEMILEGLDTKIKEYPDSDETFFTCEWKYNLYPFTNLTGLENIFIDFLNRDLIIERNVEKYRIFSRKKFKTIEEKEDEMFKKNIKQYNFEYIDFLAKKFSVSKNIEKIRAKEKLVICDMKKYILLSFTTTYFTSQKDILDLYKGKYKEIKKLLNQEELNSKDIQKKYFSEKFERNHIIARLRKRGLTYDEVSAYLFYHNIKLKEPDKYVNLIKTKLAEFNANVDKALKRKIVF